MESRMNLGPIEQYVSSSTIDLDDDGDLFLTKDGYNLIARYEIYQKIMSTLSKADIALLILTFADDPYVIEVLTDLAKDIK